MRRPHTSPATTQAAVTSKAAAQTGRVAYSSPGWGRMLLTHVVCVCRERRLRGVRLVSLPTVDTVFCATLLPLFRSELAMWSHNELFVGSAPVSAVAVAVAGTFDVACATPPFNDLSPGDIWLTPSTPSDDEDGDDAWNFPSKRSGDGGLLERPDCAFTHGGVVPGQKYRDNRGTDSRTSSCRDPNAAPFTSPNRGGDDDAFFTRRTLSSSSVTRRPLSHEP